ncbi:hypothetical protein [Nocardia sp. IFM 10818]
MSTDYDTIVDEIRTLHHDLALWLGTAGATAALDRFLTQQHPDFSMVTQTGMVVAREPLAAGLRGAGNSTPGLTIEVLDIEILHHSPDSTVARFKEVHRHPSGPRARFTTALLLADPEARNGLRWRTVHETAVAR